MTAHHHKTTVPLLAILLLTAVFSLAITPAMAAPQTRYVHGAGGADSGDCTSLTDPCKTIGYALAQAGRGDTIKVAQGTYKENLLINKNVDLFGGFNPGDWGAPPTPFGSIIDGQQLDSVVRFEGVFDSTLSGFKITNGKAELGGGVSSEMGSPRLQNLWIVNNQATDSGGGVYLTQGQASISNSKLEENEALNFGGAIHITSSSSSLINLQITGNEADSGGGLSLDNTATITLSDSMVSMNEGSSQSGAIHAVNTLLDINDSLFADNEAEEHGGVMTVEGSKVTIINGLFYGNGTLAGPASVLAMSTTDVIITNSTLADNAPGGDQAVLLWGTAGSLVLKNSIMWNNGLSFQADPPCTGCFIASYSDIQGYNGGDFNINIDPLFVNPAAADYHLQSNSPCINAGTTTGAPSSDLDGKPRSANPDMGAYEYAAVAYSHQAYLPAILGD